MQKTAREPAFDAYILLKIVFIAIPILAGLDKFFYILTDWTQYLGIMLGNNAKVFMMVVGVIEIIAGIGVIFKPKLFAYIVAVWLFGIVINLLILGDFYDIAARDLGLCLSAFALARLAKVYGR